MPEKFQNLAWIPPGNLLDADGQPTPVAGFFLQRHEVTQKAYTGLRGQNPSFRKGDQLPVENVNWEEAASYCRDLGGRLPSEAEWEYAARAATQTDYYWKNGPIDAFAWYHRNSDNQSHPVGRKQPNSWGLYDMSGNVFEWVQDWYDDGSKVVRGGSWYSDPASLKSGARFRNRPGFASFKLGLRCAFSENQVPAGLKP